MVKVTVNREDVQDVGMQFCHSDHYKKISFTGSTAVGKWLYRESASTVKRVWLHEYIYYHMIQNLCAFYEQVSLVSRLEEEC